MGDQVQLLPALTPAQSAHSHVAALLFRAEQHRWVPLAAQEEQSSRYHGLGKKPGWWSQPLGLAHTPIHHLYTRACARTHKSWNIRKEQSHKHSVDSSQWVACLNNGYDGSAGTALGGLCTRCSFF